jgi:hypothetical protein
MDGAFHGRTDVLRRRGSARHSFHSHVARGIRNIFPKITFHFLFMILQYRFPSLFSGFTLRLPDLSSNANTKTYYPCWSVRCQFYDKLFLP